MAKARAESYEVVDDKTTFPKVLNKLEVREVLGHLYKKWCIETSRGGFSIENWPEGKSRFLPKGMKFPKPQGHTWDRLVKDFWVAKGYETCADFTNVMKKSVIARELETTAVKIEELDNKHLMWHAEPLGALCTAIVRYSGNPSTAAEIDAVRVRARDHLDGVLPPPKNLKNLPMHKDAGLWLKALIAEFNSLTEIGAISHGHTLSEVRGMGIEGKPISTQVVFENKFRTAEHAGNLVVPRNRR